jgi:hypothetical protein
VRARLDAANEREAVTLRNAARNCYPDGWRRASGRYIRASLSRGYVGASIPIALRVLACFAVGFCISAFSGRVHKAIAHSSTPASIAERAPDAIPRQPAPASADNQVAADEKKEEDKEKPVAAEQAQPMTTGGKEKSLAAEQAQPIPIPPDNNNKKKEKSVVAEQARPVATGSKQKSLAVEQAHPTPLPPADKKNEKTVADLRVPGPTARESAATVTRVAARTNQQAASSERLRPNPTFYVDLGPAQDPDSPASARSDTSKGRGTAVSYRNGQLTISAEDVTLAAVLQLVALKTRAKINVPPDDGTEHIAVHAGPGPANDVLAQLLKGSRFNFVIVNSPQHPNELQEVLLSVRGPGAPALLEPPVQAEAAPKQGLPKELLEKLFSRKRPDGDVIPTTDQAPPDPPPAPEAIEQTIKDKAKEIRENADNQ